MQRERRRLQIKRQDAAIQGGHAVLVVAGAGSGGETARFGFDLASFLDPSRRESVILE